MKWPPAGPCILWDRRGGVALRPSIMTERQTIRQTIAANQAQLSVQVPGRVIGLADPGVAVGDGEHGHGVQSASFAEGFNNPVQ